MGQQSDVNVFLILLCSAESFARPAVLLKKALWEPITLTLLLMLESIGVVFCQNTTRIPAAEDRGGAGHLDLASVRIRLWPPGREKACETLLVP